MVDALQSDGKIEVILTGAFALRDGAGRRIDGLARRGQAALAYLSLCPDMRAERAALADLLWSDRGAEQARASLRQLISELRRQLPNGLLLADRQCIALDPDRVRLQRGDGVFLEGFDLASEGFEDWLRRQRMEGAPPDRPTAEPPPIFNRPAVAVFAFDAMGDDASDRMIADGLADDLRTTLCYWRWFPVIGPDATGWKTAKDIDSLAAARGAGAAYAVTGTLARIGSRVRISATLTDAGSGQTLWSQRFDGEMDDIFTFQETASHDIVAQLEPQLAQAEAARLQRSHPRGAAPWQLLAMADDIDRRSGSAYGTPDSNTRQRDLMLSALEQSPDYALAHARLGRIAFRFALLDWAEDRAQSFAEAISHAETALSIDPDSWEAHAYLGLSQIFGRRDYGTGAYHGAEAVRLNPSAPLARHAFACALEWAGQPEQALDQMAILARLHANYPGRAAILGQTASCALFTGARDTAIDAARQLVTLAPDYSRGQHRAVAIFGYYDLAQDAAAALENLRRIDPAFDESYARETYPYARPEHTELMLEGLRKAGAFD